MLRDELLEREAFDTLLETKVLIERWRQHYSVEQSALFAAALRGRTIANPLFF